MKSPLCRKRSIGTINRRRPLRDISTNIDSLPDDLVIKILVQFPPEDLHNGARLVCKKWNRIINSPDFIHENLQHSPPGLLIRYLCYRSKHLVFVAMQQGRIKISELNYKLFKGYSMGSCNGLVLDYNNNSIGGGDASIYHVVNPTTGQRFALPPISLKRVINSCAVMAYAAASKEYKVVLTYLYSCTRVTKVQCCAILTVGVDRDWRHINNERLISLTAAELLCSPVIAQGSIHWTQRQSTRVLTFNVDTEVFTSTPVPQGYEKTFKYFLTTGTSLTMLVVCSNLSWEVWELKREESGEWMKLYKIDLEDQMWTLLELVAEYSGNISPIIHTPDGYVTPMTLEPVGWLNYGEVLVLHASHRSSVCFIYNVRTQEISSFQLNHSFHFPRFRFHRNSLVQLVV